MSNSTTNRRERAGKGLHLNLNAGEYIEVDHAGEKMRVHINGKNGYNKYQISVIAPQTFKIDYPKNQETGIDFVQIDKWVDANLKKKPEFCNVDQKEWEDALIGYRNTMAQALVGDECSTQECWGLIYYSAIGFCRGMERAEVKAGTKPESMFPRY